MSNGHQQIFLQVGYTNGQKTHRKILSKSINKLNANQNHNEISLHTYEVDSNIKTETCQRECREMETSCSAREHGNGEAIAGKSVTSNHTPGYPSKEWRTWTQISAHMFTVHNNNSHKDY